MNEVKKLNAAKARVKVYDDAESISAKRSSLHGIEAKSETQAVPILSHIPFQALNGTQVQDATSLAFVPQNPGVQPPATISQTLKVPSPPFIPQATQAPAAVNQPQQNLDLVSILAKAISANRLPTPEPILFTGEPLKFKDWQLSFETLIERKNIPKNERLYYLRKRLWTRKKSG